jgi:hypothetical protein
MSIVGPVQMAIEKYKLNVCHLAYNISWHAMNGRDILLDRNKVNNEILKFITQKNTNANFFVMTKKGKIIFKNYPLSKVVKEDNAKELDELS